MKITYLKLKNFIGIYNGMGLKEIELDFTKGNNTITLLIGKNGCGKSTIMSTLHPFSGTFDDKTSFILDGLNGYKEIHIDANGILYTIKHYYDNKKKNKSVKSFISYKDENGKEIELNESGGVRLFEEIIKDKLDLVPSFLTLSKIGSNVSNFIDKKSTDRKKMISEFLPDIDEFLHSYKTINDKWSSCRKDIKTVTDNISKIENIDVLKDRELSVLSSIKHYEDLVQSESQVISGLQYNIKRIDPNGDIRSTFVTLGTEFNELKSRLNEMKTVSFGKYSDLDIVNENLTKLVLKRESLKEKNNELENTNKVLSTEIDALNIKINDTNSELEVYKTDKNLNEYYELREKYTNELNEYNKLVNSSNIKKYYANVTLKDIETYDSEFCTLESSIEAIKEKVETEIIESLYTADIETLSNKTIPELKSVLLTANEKRNQLNTEIASLMSNLHQKDILAQRPETCSDNTCPFIREALKFANIEIKLEQKQKNLTKLNDKIKTIEQSLDLSQNVYSTYLEVNALLNKTKAEAALSKVHYFRFIDLKWFIEFMLGNRDKYRLISDIKDIVSVYDDIKFIEKNLDEVNSNIRILEEKQNVINILENNLNSFNNDVRTKEEKIVKNDEKIKNNNENLDKLDKLELVLNEAKDYYIELNRNKERYIELRNTLKTINDKVEEIKSNNKVIKEKSELVDEYNSKLEPLRTEIEKIKFDIIKYNDYNETKSKLESTYNNLNILRDALNPTKGIPLLFINTYLTKTKIIANNLLDVAFKGKFRIEDFEVTDKDFFIKLKKADGELMSDVIYASQGERALISLSISMALIQQSMKKYNILLLDEIDAELDDSNRKSFIEILEAQFEMLGIEQCFLITHNNEFDTYNTNLILLKNHNVDINNEDYMSNKQIIFKV